MHCRVPNFTVKKRLSCVVSQRRPSKRGHAHPQQHHESRVRYQALDPGGRPAMVQVRCAGVHQRGASGHVGGIERGPLSEARQGPGVKVVNFFDGAAVFAPAPSCRVFMQRVRDRSGAAGVFVTATGAMARQPCSQGRAAIRRHMTSIATRLARRAMLLSGAWQVCNPSHRRAHAWHRRDCAPLRAYRPAWL